MGSFEPYSDLSKLVMIALMWLGRLEIIPIVVLFTTQLLARVAAEVRTSAGPHGPRPRIPGGNPAAAQSLPR